MSHNHSLPDSSTPLPVPAVVQPPPPPPPVAPPPVRKAAVPRSAPRPVASPENQSDSSGVGSVKGIRWRGEWSGIKNPDHDPPPSDTANDFGGSDGAETAPPPAVTDRVTRGAPSWLVSLIIHLLVLLILAFITTPAGSGIGRIVLSIGQAETGTQPDLFEFSLDAEEVPMESDAMATDFDAIEVPAIFEEISLADTESIEMAEVTEASMIQSSLASTVLADVPVMFGGRTGTMKQTLLSIYGGTTETQDAVKLGLRWLKRNQRKNGTWSMRGPYRDGAHSENDCAATAMALIAFLGDGHTHQNGEYKKEVEKGMKRLVRMQNRSGFFADQSRTHEKPYAQAQATIAICEMYAMTGDSWLRSPAQAALDYAERAQSRQGGWRYRPYEDSDTSVTGWFVMALESGRSAGLEVSSSALEHANEFLNKVQANEGAAYSYEIGRTNPSPAMTAEGLLCRQYLGWKHNHPIMKEGLEALGDQYPFDIRDGNVYYWYYATQAMHHYGGDPWQRWNASMRVELPAAQIRKGTEIGSWAPQEDVYGASHGRLYTTCLSLYCLEVYYRHMPLYASQPQASQSPTTKSSESDQP